MTGPSDRPNRVRSRPCRCALWISSQFGLIAAGAYLLSGAICTLVALWLNRELARSSSDKDRAKTA